MDSGRGVQSCSILFTCESPKLGQGIGVNSALALAHYINSSPISLSTYSSYLSSHHYHQVYCFCVSVLRESSSFPARPAILFAALQSLLTGCCSTAALDRHSEGEYAFILPYLALRLAREYRAILDFEYPEEYRDQRVEMLLTQEELARVLQDRLEEGGWGREDELVLQDAEVGRIVRTEKEGEKVRLRGEGFVVAEDWLRDPKDYIRNEGIIKHLNPEKYIYTRHISLKSNLIPYVHYRLLSLKDFLSLAQVHGCPYAILRSPSEIHLRVISIYWPDGSYRKLQVSRLDPIAAIIAILKPLLSNSEFRLWGFSQFSVTPTYLSQLGQARSLVYFPGTIAREMDTVGGLRLGFNGNSLLIEPLKSSNCYYLTDAFADPRCANCLATPKKQAFSLHCTHCSKANYCSDHCLQVGKVNHEQLCEWRGCWKSLIQPRKTAGMCNGLKNYGMVCYANSVLQALASFTSVRKMAKRHREAEGLVRLFSELISRLRSPSQSPLTAKSLIATLTRSYPQFTPGELHDSHEFLTCLLAALHDSLKKPCPQPLHLPEELQSGYKSWLTFLSQQESDVAKALFGMLQTSVLCPCGNREGTYQEFSTLELPLTDYVGMDMLEVWYFPTDSQSKRLQIATQREITVSDLVTSLSDIGETVMIAYLRGSELVVLSPDISLRKYIAAKVPLLAYFRPKEYPPLYYEVYLVVKEEVVAMPRVVFVKADMTLVDVHRGVFQALRVYYTKDEEFAPPKGDRSNGYDLYYHHSDPIVVCGLCGREGERSCPLPYTGVDAIGFLRQYGPKVRLEVKWQMRQTRVKLDQIDSEKCVFSRKMLKSVSLSSCIASMLSEEKLDAENCWTCSVCSQQVKASIHLSLLQAPNALILHIKRFNASGRKLMEKVQFPIDLVLDLKPNQVERPMHKTYSLCSIVCHQGATLESGHFRAVSRVGSRWMLLDDCKAVEISEEEVLRLEAYLLFYECVEGQE